MSRCLHPLNSYEIWKKEEKPEEKPEEKLEEKPEEKPKEQSFAAETKILPKEPSELGDALPF